MSPLKPLKLRHREQFLAYIAHEFRGNDPVDPEQIARGVFTVLSSRVTDGEIEDVKQVLPAEIRELWPQSGPSNT